MTEEVVLWSGRARRLLAQRASPPFGARGQSTKNLHLHSQAVEGFHLAMQQGLRSRPGLSALMRDGLLWVLRKRLAIRRGGKRVLSYPPPLLHFFSLEADPNPRRGPAPITSALSWIPPPVPIAISISPFPIVLIDLDASFGRIGEPFFCAPTIAGLIAHDGGRRTRAQSDSANDS